MTTHSTPEAFSTAAEHLLLALGDALDRLAADSDADVDWQLRDGVLSVDIDERQWVINAHAPRQEIWLAGGTGAYHFQRDPHGVWRDTRSHHTFAAIWHDALRNAGITDSLRLPPECGEL